jgi:hypothetical protein
LFSNFSNKRIIGGPLVPVAGSPAGASTIDFILISLSPQYMRMDRICQWEMLDILVNAG